jgi:hypothetical protein
MQASRARIGGFVVQHGILMSFDFARKIGDRFEGRGRTLLELLQFASVRCLAAVAAL